MTDQRLMYFVQREDGQFYSGQKKWPYNACWVPKLSHAKLLTKIGPAKSACTFMHKHYPNQQPIHIIEFDLSPSNGKVIDITAHVQASITKIREREEWFTQQARKLERERLERAQDRAVEEILNTASVPPSTAGEL